MFLIKVTITILLVADLVHNFPVGHQKVPSTYDIEECPPGIIACYDDKHDSDPDTTRGDNAAKIVINATSQVTTPMPLRNNARLNHKKHLSSNGSSVNNTAEDGRVRPTSKINPDFCPPGIWVCRKKRAIRRKLIRRGARLHQKLSHWTLANLVIL